MTTLPGLLVDLVPFSARFEAREHDWRNHEGVFFWSMGDHWFETHSAQERDRAELRADAGFQQHSVRFGVQTKAGTPIGQFAVFIWHPHHRLGMLSALIGEPEYWGGGYGTDALLLLADYAFDWLDLHKLWLMTMALNARVMRQMEKVGFELEVRYRAATWADNGWVDALAYGMPRSAWPGRAALVERLGLRARDVEPPPSHPLEG